MTTTMEICTHERQTYFGQKLPCWHPYCPGGTNGPTVAVAVSRDRPPRAGLDLSQFASSMVKVTFHRAQLAADPRRVVWIPDPCIDRHVDAMLTEKLIAAGLEGALTLDGPGGNYREAQATQQQARASTYLQAQRARANMLAQQGNVPSDLTAAANVNLQAQAGGPPHLHGVVYVAEGEPIVERCPGCVYSLAASGPGSYFGVDRTQAQQQAAAPPANREERPLMEKPTRAEVGHRYKYDGNGLEWEVLAQADGDRVKCIVRAAGGGWNLGEEYVFTRSAFSSARYLGPSSIPGRRVDWARWLPPHDLRDTGAKALKSGQVWAWRYAAGASGVVRIVHEIGGSQETLASGYLDNPGPLWFEGSGKLGQHAVLVADVGCEPTPPEILYAPTTPLTGVPGPCGATSETSPLRPCLLNPDHFGAHESDAGFRWHADARKVAPSRCPAMFGPMPCSEPAGHDGAHVTLPTGTTPPPRAGSGYPYHGHAEEAKQRAIAASVVAKLPPKAKPEPWYPSVDEFDLLPDAGT